MSMYVYTWACMYECIHAFMFFVSRCVCIYRKTYMIMYAYVLACIYEYVHLSLYVGRCTWVYVYVCMYAYMNECTYVCMCPCMYIKSLLLCHCTSVLNVTEQIQLPDCKYNSHNHCTKWTYRPTFLNTYWKKNTKKLISYFICYCHQYAIVVFNIFSAKGVMWLQHACFLAKMVA